MNHITKKHHKTFEDIRRKTEAGGDFWSARDLQKVLNYKSWNKFKSVIIKAIKACENSGVDPSDHFSQMGKMVKSSSGAKRYISDYDCQLTHYACYLIVQGEKARKTMQDLGGTMPENLPTPQSSVKALERKNRTIQKNKRRTNVKSTK